MYNIFIFAAFVACASAFDIVNYTSYDGCNCGYKFILNNTNEYIEPRVKDNPNNRTARHLADETQNCLRSRRWTEDGAQSNTRSHKDMKGSWRHFKTDNSKDAPKCWAQKFPTRRLTIGLNADETGVNEFPMMAGLAFYDPVHRLTGELYTGGTIISKRYVLTAAHVLTVMQVTKTMVILGEHHRSILELSPHRQEILPRRFIIHERYRTRVLYDSHDYDVGIIELDKTIEFTPRVGPACLPFKFRDTELAGMTGTYIGWGQVFESGPVSDVLRKIDVRIISQDECKDKVVTQLTDRMLCAHSPNADACGNDSGGPLLYMDPETKKLFVVGIISHGKGCVSISYAGVNTRVTKFLDWIARVAPDDYCGQPPPVVNTTHHEDIRTVTDEMTEPGTYPVMAGIFYAYGDFHLLATGTVLSADTIITTASAIRRIVDKKISTMVMLGEEIIKRGPTLFYQDQHADAEAISPAMKPYRYLIHPKYEEGNIKYDVGLINFKERIKECRTANEPSPAPTTTPNPLSLPANISKDWGAPFDQFDDFWRPPANQCFNVSTLTDTQLCDFQPGKSNCDYDRNGNIVYKSFNGKWDMGLITYGRCAFCVNEKAGGDDRVYELTDWISQAKPPPRI